MKKPQPRIVTVKACDGAKILLRVIPVIPSRIALTAIDGILAALLDLTPHKARQLAYKLHAMADAIEEAQRAGAGGK